MATLDHPYDSALSFIDGKPVHTRNKDTVTDDKEEERQSVRGNVDTRRGRSPAVRHGRVEAGTVRLMAGWRGSSGRRSTGTAASPVPRTRSASSWTR